MNLNKLLTFITLSLAVLPTHAQQKGLATFYSQKMQGARTASGQKLDNNDMVCAHKTHPFGTKLNVKNPANGKEVTVTVIDRGPHTKNRIIDLSFRAAKELGIVSKGVAPVVITIIEKNESEERKINKKP